MALSKVVANVGADSQRSSEYLRLKRANNNVMQSLMQSGANTAH